MQVSKVKRPGRKAFTLLLLALVFTFLPGCGLFGGEKGEIGTDKQPQVQQPVTKFTGAKSRAISYVYTTKRELALTFNGMADRGTMTKLLDELDRYRIKATFFLPGMRVAEEPDIAQDIKSRGHEIENNTLNGLDLSKLTYDQMYKEIRLANQVIEKETGAAPRYVRTKTGTYNDDIRLAAAHNGQSAVISYSLFLHNWNQETELQKKQYIRKYINRGGIITLDIEENKQLEENISLIAAAAKDVGYTFVPLSNLVAEGSERKPLEEIAGYDAAKPNADYHQVPYNLIYRKETPRKEIALSFDDWGTDYTITHILDILDKYQIKASFFLRADGVEKNPNLARAIAEAGHDVGNHTYSHPVLDTQTAEQLQNEVVKAHQVITEAIQQKPAMIFRPPTGEINEAEARMISAAGYHTIADFDVDPNDWNRSRTADQIVKTITEQTRSGSIILLHMLDDLHTIEALPEAIEKLKGKGYTFVRVSDLLNP
ncbi:polysaccharide deacetylase family protein [Paenibacillus sp. HJL G12]|uniref:Polysaccharide deacetylase family protein n=2 Tax=Paenibacillus dendrobii TaxID=2691084 RepID=A0A7X3LKD0_9BACL|nr:polysaccharide deacetylase family protein [Paenibacillus dendrobii]MWV46354.1 polysaccharide deacetylase family protein [Paenibacillus dendrobii]